MICWFIAALATERFRAKRLRRASKLLRLSHRQFPRSISHLEAPEALGQLPGGSKGSGSSHHEAPGALGAAVSTIQKL